MAGGLNRRRWRRLAEAVAVALLVAGILATAAVAALRVNASSVEFRAVTPYEFSNGNRVYRDYDIVVEPYHDAFRTGYRARPRVGQQSGPIGTSDGDCIGNGIVNDVVCSVFSRSISVDLENGGKNDAVALRENQRESELPEASPQNPTPSGLSCQTRYGTPSMRVTALVRLGGGHDSFRVVTHNDTVCSGDAIIGRPFGVQIAGVEVYGGAGDDTITGFLEDDTISGGTGDDVLSAGKGDDMVLGGSGDDTVNGGAGRDRLNGGTGFDTLTYADRSAPLFITLGDSIDNDGEAGERDLLVAFDKVLGGDGSDRIVGSVADERLYGRDGHDRLEGGNGDDLLVGGSGQDVLQGGAGRDSLSGGEGSDILRTRDLQPDTVSCGSGGDTIENDRAEVDLEDTGWEDCETVIRYPIGAGEPGRVTSQTVRPNASGAASFTVFCPAEATVRCEGELSLRAVSAAGVVSMLPIAKAEYSIPVGTSQVLQATATTWPARVQVTTQEAGVGSLQRTALRLFSVS